MDKRTKMMVVAVVLTAAIYAAGKIASFAAESLGGDSMFIPVVVRTVISLACIIALGGAGWLRPSWRSVRETFSFAMPLFILNLILGFLLAFNVISEVLAGNIPLEQVLRVGSYTTLLCILVGINEEAMFRGLLYGGFMAKWGGTPDGILRSALISALAFGFLHVAFTMDYTNVYSIGTGLMKTLETGMFGFVFCVPALKGKNITGPMLVHAFFDWVVLCGNSIPAGEVALTSYTTSNPQIAMMAMALFGIMALVFLPRTIRAYKELRSMEAPQYGPFVPSI